MVRKLSVGAENLSGRDVDLVLPGPVVEVKSVHGFRQFEPEHITALRLRHPRFGREKLGDSLPVAQALRMQGLAQVPEMQVEPSGFTKIGNGRLSLILVLK